MNILNSISVVPKLVSLKLNRSTIKFMVYPEDMQNINIVKILCLEGQHCNSA